MSWLDDPVLANRLQWDGRSSGFYEEFTMDLIDPSNASGWRFRYGLTSPVDGDASSSLWGAHFSAEEDPTRFALQTDFGIRSFATQSDGFHIRVSKGELTRNQAKGGLRNPNEPAHSLRWNVNLNAHADPVPVYGKESQYSGREPATKVLVPTPFAQAGGVVEIGDERFVVRGGRGVQAHRWGRARFDSWAQGYATFFRERPRAWLHAFQGGQGGHQVGGLHYQDSEGLDLHFDKVKTTQDGDPSSDPGVWTFTAKRRGWELTGRFSASLQRMVGVRNQDPDGEPRFCHHAGLADATIELWKKSWGRKQLHQTLTAKGTCMFEQGARRPFDAVEFFL